MVGLPSGVRLDLRHALRGLRRQGRLTLAAVATLALGVGVSAAVLSIVHAALVQPASYPDPGQLLDVQSARDGGSRFGLAPADFLALRDGSRAFEQFGGYFTVGAATWTGTGASSASDTPGDGAERLKIHYATAGFFAALSVPPLHGRTFRPAEEEPGADRVAVLGHGFWRRRLASDPAVVGRSLRLDGELYRVVGVMPRGFGGRGGACDLWLPLAFGPEGPTDRASHYVGAVGRLADGVSRRAAEAELTAIARDLERRFPDTNRDLGVSVRPLTEVMTERVRPVMGLLAGAACFLLLVACANVAGLQLARGVARSQELAMRTALGAGRWRLLRLSLLEGFLLSLGGGAAGVALATAGLRLLPDLRGPYLYDYTRVGLDGWVAAGVVVVVALTTVLVGLLPGLQRARPDLRRALAGAAGPRGGGGRRRVLQALVVMEVAAALVLLVGAGLLLRSVQHLTAVEPGYRTDEVLAATLSLPEGRYPGDADHVAFHRGVLAALRELPGVNGAAVSNLPPGRGWGTGLRLEGQGEGRGAGARLLMVSPGWFGTVGIPVLRGRGVEASDGPGSAPVIVLNQRAAESFFPDVPAVGRWIEVSGLDGRHEVVGVVGDVRADPSQEAVRPAVYLPLLRYPRVMAEVGDPTLTLLVRSTAGTGSIPGTGASTLAAPVRQVIAAADPGVAVSDVRTLADERRAEVARPRLDLGLIGAFAIIALALAAAGVFGVLTYAVVGRRREIGVRMALGAQRGRVLGTVLAEGAGLALAGTAVGLAVAVALRRLVASLVHGISPGDPPTYAAVAAGVMAVALLACWLPARRAAGEDPARALRGPS